MNYEHWMFSASCATTDPDLFFPEYGSSEHAGYTKLALKVCNNCLVKTECGEYALQNPELRGIWGGMTEMDRDRIHRRKRYDRNSSWRDKGSRTSTTFTPMGTGVNLFQNI